MNKEQLKEEFKEALSNKEVLINAYNLIIIGNKEVLKDDKTINDFLETNIAAQEIAISKKPELRTQKDYLEELFVTDKDILINNLTKEIDQAKEEQKKIIKAVERKSYSKYIDDLLSDKPLKYAFFTKYNYMLMFLIDQVIAPKNISKKEKEERERYINLLTNKINLKFVSDKEKTKKGNNLNDILDSNFKPSPLYFSEYLTFSNSALIDSLSHTHSIVLKDNGLIKQFDYTINQESINNATNDINKLNELDRFVLDTITIEFYLKRHRIVFSDRDIALLLAQTDSKVSISDKFLKQINESILKIQNVRITLDYESKKVFENNSHRIIEDNNPLIWLKTRKDIKDTKTQWYQILNTPFYYDYLSITNNKLLEFNRSILYKEIEGKDKSINNQKIRLLINRRLRTAKDLKIDFYISTNEIYKEQQCETRKQKQDAREMAKKILDNLKNDEGFNYREDNTGVKGSIKGYWIEFKKPENKQK